MSAERECFYTHTGEIKKMRSGCPEVSREFIPQLDMQFCPFCGGTIRRVVTVDQIPEFEPDPGEVA